MFHCVSVLCTIHSFLAARICCIGAIPSMFDMFWHWSCWTYMLHVDVFLSLLAGWWLGTLFHVFQRGRYTTNQLCFFLVVVRNCLCARSHGAKTRTPVAWIHVRFCRESHKRCRIHTRNVLAVPSSCLDSRFVFTIYARIDLKTRYHLYIYIKVDEQHVQLVNLVFVYSKPYLGWFPLSGRHIISHQIILKSQNYVLGYLDRHTHIIYHIYIYIYCYIVYIIYTGK